MKRILAMLSCCCIIISLSLITACSTGVQKNPALEKAQAAYAAAKTRPGIDQAAVPLYEAEKALAKAEKAEDYDEKTRLSDLAEKKIAYAVAVADRKAAEEQMKTLGEEKKKAILAARQAELDAKEKEIEKTRKQVEDAQEKARVLQSEAQRAQSEAERAQNEAKAKAAEAEMVRQKAEQLERELSELKALKTDRGIVLTLGDVLFASGKADLMPGANRSVDKLSAFLMDNPTRNIVIEGHTDNVGSDEYNQSLSQRRADAVRMALTYRGITDNRMIAKGYGESFPVADNSSEAGRQQNRRVEIIILDEGMTSNDGLRK